MGLIVACLWWMRGQYKGMHRTYARALQIGIPGFRGPPY